MEFKEFRDPLSEDYDLRVSDEEIVQVNNPAIEEANKISMALINITGFLEDDEANDEYTMEHYGITVNEYLKPNANTLKKVRNHLQEMSNKKSK